MPKKEQFWKDEEVDVLLKMWRQYSASQIGAMLGRTRNSVIGKINRLVGKGMIRDRSKKVYLLPRMQMPRPQPIRVKPIMAEPPPKPPPPPPPLFVEPVEMLGCTIYDLNDRRCKWPLGATYEVAKFYCGEASEDGRPYCHDHCCTAYPSYAHAAQ